MRRHCYNHILTGSYFKPLLVLLLATVGSILTPTSTADAQTADDLLMSGREAFMNYNFGEATRLYGQAKAKARRTDEFFADKYEKYSRQLLQAKGYLERVENIEIIDSISVPRAEFFKHYRIPASAGILGGIEAVPRQFRDNTKTDYVFTSERGNYKIWAQPSDSTDYNVLVESSLLTDGSWSEPVVLDEDLCEEGDAAYPFMMADGVTLYYADNGENSIGGYDIMVATRDAADGTFMQPSNLGFPYNSPYDDYLLAIDELNGIGWWATDRNQLDDLLTIYVFIPRELRNNYPSDQDNIIELARISDYMITQPEDADYHELQERIKGIIPGTTVKERDFTLPAPGGKIYTTFDELPTGQLRDAVKRYLSAQKNLDRDERNLTEMRMEYHKTKSMEIGNRIRRAETEIEQTRKEVKSLKSEVYKFMK